MKPQRGSKNTKKLVSHVFGADRLVADDRAKRLQADTGHNFTIAFPFRFDPDPPPFCALCVLCGSPKSGTAKRHKAHKAPDESESGNGDFLLPFC